MKPVIVQKIERMYSTKSAFIPDGLFDLRNFNIKFKLNKAGQVKDIEPYTIHTYATQFSAN